MKELLDLDFMGAYRAINVEKRGFTWRKLNLEKKINKQRKQQQKAKTKTKQNKPD